MNKRDIRRAEMAADLLCPPPEIVNATRLRDVVDYLWHERGLRTSREILAAIRNLKWASPTLQLAKDVRARVKRMVDRGVPPPLSEEELRRFEELAHRRGYTKRADGKWTKPKPRPPGAPRLASGRAGPRGRGGA